MLRACNTEMQKRGNANAGNAGPSKLSAAEPSSPLLWPSARFPSATTSSAITCSVSILSHPITNIRLCAARRAGRHLPPSDLNSPSRHTPQLVSAPVAAFRTSLCSPPARLRFVLGVFTASASTMAAAPPSWRRALRPHRSSGYPVELFLAPVSVYECSICMAVCKDAQGTSCCSRLLCLLCLQRWMRSKKDSGAAKCPMCNPHLPAPLLFAASPPTPSPTASSALCPSNAPGSVVRLG